MKGYIVRRNFRVTTNCITYEVQKNTIFIYEKQLEIEISRKPSVINLNKPKINELKIFANGHLQEYEFSDSIVRNVRKLKSKQSSKFSKTGVVDNTLESKIIVEVNRLYETCKK